MCTYSVAPSGSLSVPFSGGEFSLTITRMSGTCGWQATTDVSWLTPSSTSGSGTATLTIRYSGNATFVGRAGTVIVQWSGGSAQLSVRQAAETPAFCRIVTVTVGGQSTIDVPASGGQFTASITPEPGTPLGVCSTWKAVASPGITIVGLDSGPAAPASVTFVVQANPLASGRSMSLTVTFGSGPSPVLTVRQAAKP